MVSKRSPEREDILTDPGAEPTPKKAKTAGTEKKVESLRVRPDDVTSPDKDRLPLLSTSTHLSLTEPTETPGLVLATKGGQLPHVTRDLYEPLSTLDVISLDSVVHAPGRKGLEAMGLTLGQFCKARNKILLNPFNSYTAPDMTTFNDQLGVSVWTKGGRKKLANHEYLALVDTAKPDLFIALADVVPASVSKKRADRSCYRTLQWLTETLAHCGGGERVLAMIPGSGHPQLMLRSAQLLATRDVTGYVIERASLPLQGWSGILREAISLLPASRPIYMLGVLDESELVEAYRCGCHYVDTSFLSRHATLGLALCSSSNSSETIPSEGSAALSSGTSDGAAALTSVPSERAAALSSEASEGAQPPAAQFGPSLATMVPERGCGWSKQEKSDSKRGVKLIFTGEVERNSPRLMDLRDATYARQFTPLEPGCGCLTCTKHTRAYLHHLLNTKEMLAPTLLSIHNLHHVRALVARVREALRAGTDLATWEL